MWAARGLSHRLVRRLAQSDCRPADHPRILRRISSAAASCARNRAIARRFSRPPSATGRPAAGANQPFHRAPSARRSPPNVVLAEIDGRRARLNSGRQDRQQRRLECVYDAVNSQREGAPCPSSGPSSSDFFAGVIAKLVTPGDNHPGGFILTTILGVLGAVLATWGGSGDRLVSGRRGRRLSLGRSSARWWSLRFGAPCAGALRLRLCPSAQVHH